MSGPGKTVLSNASLPERREFEVIQAAKNAPDEVVVGNKTMAFGSSGGFKIRDMGVAQEINEIYGHGRRGTRQVVVVPVEKPPERGHKRTFVVRLPENYKRSAQ